MLRQIRKQQKITQQELAAKSGVHQTTISRYERGRGRKDWEKVSSLANALGVKAEELFPINNDTEA